jgi:D-lactate dehydrogenase
MKIAYATPYEGEKEIIATLLTEHEVHFIDAPIRETIPDEVRDAEVLSVFVDSRISEAMIDSMPNLRVIALRSTGYDHVPVAYAEGKGIVVSYVPHYGSQTVAEFAFALILALSRKAYAAYDVLRTTGEVYIKKFEGFDLKGKTIGIVGTGAIGRHVCQIAQGFGMRVIAYDLYPNEAFATERGITYKPFLEVLAEADIVTLHVPASAENKYLLNDTTLRVCKKGAYVINTARGDLIDTVALVKVLKEGYLAGVGLDVYEGEAFIRDEMELLTDERHFDEHTWKAFAAEHELLDMENAIITPHVAFNSVEAKREITETTVENIKASLLGEPKNIVALK